MVRLGQHSLFGTICINLVAFTDFAIYSNPVIPQKHACYSFATVVVGMKREYYSKELFKATTDQQRRHELAILNIRICAYSRHVAAS